MIESIVAVLMAWSVVGWVFMALTILFTYPLENLSKKQNIMLGVLFTVMCPMLIVIVPVYFITVVPLEKLFNRLGE